MKLSKIYSNKQNFKEVLFSDGFNVIIGKVTKNYDREKDTHNLGKTTLIHIIDFMLLKDIGKDKEHIFKRHKQLFNGYVFYLEIHLNNGRYLTIKRSVSKPSKISIKLHDDKYQNFVDCNDWDYKELGLSSKFPEQNPKVILNNILDFNVLRDYDYRKTLGYFLRSQEDYNKVFHLSKFAGGDIDWKPFLFELLGFDKTYVHNKYELEAKEIEQKKIIAGMETEFAVNTDEIDKINGIIQIKNEEKKDLESLLDNFDFYLKEASINRTLVEEIETKISDINSVVYRLNFELDKINKSLSYDVGNSFDLREIEHIFNEVQLYFPNQLKKEYQDLVDFNKRITAERNKYLSESLVQKEKELQENTSELYRLNKRRTELLSVLREKDSFKKFKYHQTELIIKEREIERLVFQLEIIDVIKNANDSLKTISDQINESADKIRDEIAKDNNLFYKKIRLMFNQLIKSIIKQSGILSIKINKKGNVEFHAEIVDGNDETTSKGKGHTYKKILCVCFDLSLLINYSVLSFYRFVYHDGSLESLDSRKKIEYLNLVKSICDEYDIQYILTLIEDDLPRQQDGSTYQFSDDEIALILDDRDNNEGRLFGISF